MDKKEFLEKAIKVSKLARIMAKTMDVVPVLLLPILTYSFGLYQLGIYLGLAYLIVADALQGGQSFGKRIMGFAVKSLEDGSPCSIKQSAIRNLPFILPLILGIIPFWGWVLGGLLGIIFVGGEFYFLYHSDTGHRFGDIMADTTVMANDDDQLVDLKKRKTSWFASNTTESI